MRIGAKSGLRVAGSDTMALIEGGTGNGIMTDTNALLAFIGFGAGIGVVARIPAIKGTVPVAAGASVAILAGFNDAVAADRRLLGAILRTGLRVLSQLRRTLVIPAFASVRGITMIQMPLQHPWIRRANRKRRIDAVFMADANRHARRI